MSKGRKIVLRLSEENHQKFEEISTHLNLDIHDCIIRLAVKCIGFLAKQSRRNVVTENLGFKLEFSLAEAAKGRTFECQQCGRCCLEFGSSLSYSSSEVLALLINKRFDVLKYVDVFYTLECSNCGYVVADKFEFVCPRCRGHVFTVILGGDGWFTERRELAKCPFLKKQDEKYICKIYSKGEDFDPRPLKCQLFPIDINRKCSNCGYDLEEHVKNMIKNKSKQSSEMVEEILLEMSCCPKCNASISHFHEWALENCPAVKKF